MRNIILAGVLALSTAAVLAGPAGAVSLELEVPVAPPPIVIGGGGGFVCIGGVLVGIEVGAPPGITFVPFGICFPA